MSKTESKNGLDLLDDDVLVAIVEKSLEDHSGQLSYEGKIAFRELADRSGKDLT